MSKKYFSTKDPSHYHETVNGLLFCSDQSSHRYDEQERKKRNRHGSVFYRPSPPDDYDPWQWCDLCVQWHLHGPCIADDWDQMR